MKSAKRLYSHFYRDLEEKGSTLYVSIFEEDVDRFISAVRNKYGFRLISIDKGLEDGFWNVKVTLKKGETIKL